MRPNLRRASLPPSKLRELAYRAQTFGENGPVTYTFDELAAINRQVAAAFDARERRPWSLEIVMVELAKQVGDLAKAVLTTEGYYLGDRDSKPGYRAGSDRVGDELADILYCVMRVADHYQIDLGEAHVRARTAEWHYACPDAPVPWAG
jgi:NTP pyrophosphatase (non-canonical NTP hydrolase)